MVGILPFPWRRIQYVEPQEEQTDLALEWDLSGWGEDVGVKARVPLDRVERHILLIRGEKVMLDTDLADLYGVSTKVLNQAVRRNIDRFPDDFMFRLTAEEADSLRSQFVTSNSRGGRRYLPYAFTEQGVAMLSSVLRSKRAIQVNVQIMRTFVRLRQLLSSNAELSKKLALLERKYDVQFKAVFDAIRALMTPPEADEPPRKRIGYHTEAAARP